MQKALNIESNLRIIVIQLKYLPSQYRYTRMNKMSVMIGFCMMYKMNFSHGRS